jgi:hypothetical protein
MRPVVRFSIAFVLLIALVAGGTLGYTSIEGWSIDDSLYVTMITVTTVGYGEVNTLTPVVDNSRSCSCSSASAPQAIPSPLLFLLSSKARLFSL